MMIKRMRLAGRHSSYPPVETRGARTNGSLVHSIWLPGYNISMEILFGLPGHTLSLRRDSGSSAEPFVGLRHGLDSVLDLA